MMPEHPQGLSLSAFSARLGESQSAAIIGALLAPGLNRILGKINSASPNVLPSPGSIIDAWMRGWIPGPLAGWALGKQGVNIGQVANNALGNELGVENPKYANVWSGVAELARLRPSIDLWHQGFFRQLVTPEIMTKVYSALNCNDPDWRLLLPVMRAWPSAGELGVGLNRGILTPNEYQEMLLLTTGMRDDARKLLDELRKGMPGIGEVVSMYARALSASSNGAFKQLWEELPEHMRKWFGWAGLDYETGISPPPDANMGTVRWAEIEWANHWRNPGWGFVREALWRLRSDNKMYWSGISPSAEPMDDAQAKEWLKHDSVPHGVRAQMLAMRYLPVSVRYLKTMWQQQIVDTPFAEEQLKQNGQDPVVVDYIIRSWVKEQKEKEQKAHEKKQAECAKRLIARIEADLELGLIDPDDAGKALQERGLQQEDYPDCFAAALLSRRHAIVRALLGKVRGLYLTGGLDFDGAQKALTEAGLTSHAASQYLSAWTLELSLEARQAGGQAVAQWLRLGLITAEDAGTRLKRLGYGNVDLALLLLQSDSSADALKLQAEEALSPVGNVGAASVVRLLRDTERIRIRSQQMLRKLTPIARIKRMYLSHTVSATWARERLSSIGEDDESVSFYLSEWDATLEAKASAAPKTKKASGPPSPIGQTAVPASAPSGNGTPGSESTPP